MPEGASTAVVESKYYIDNEKFASQEHLEHMNNTYKVRATTSIYICEYMCVCVCVHIYVCVCLCVRVLFILQPGTQLGGIR